MSRLEIKLAQLKQTSVSRIKQRIQSPTDPMSSPIDSQISTSIYLQLSNVEACSKEYIQIGIFLRLPCMTSRSPGLSCLVTQTHLPNPLGYTNTIETHPQTHEVFDTAVSGRAPIPVRMLTRKKNDLAASSNCWGSNVNSKLSWASCPSDTFFAANIIKTWGSRGPHHCHQLVFSSWNSSNFNLAS